MIRERGMRNYPQWAADDRDLLLEAVERLKLYLLETTDYDKR